MSTITTGAIGAGFECATVAATLAPEDIVVNEAVRKGRAVYRSIEKVRIAIEQELLTALSGSERQQFHSIVDKLEQHARQALVGKGTWKQLMDRT